MHLKKLRLTFFSEWLVNNGFQILVATNNWEVLRFKSSNGTGIIYKNKHDHLTFNEYADTAYFSFFQKGVKWPAPEKRKRRKIYDVVTRTLLARDGDRCFYCGHEMAGDDITREHLLAVNSGGINHIDNLALAHSKCNEAAGHLPIVKKIEFRDKLRARFVILTDVVSL